MIGCREKMGSDAESEAGFTLVEVLVALALFSVLVILLFNNVRFGLRAWQLGSSHSELFERSIATQDLLRRTMGNIYPMLVGSEAQPSVDFEGAKETVSFLADAPLVSGGAGRFRFKLLAERKQNRTDLVISSTPELANPQDSSMTTKSLLLADIDQVDFAYSGGEAAAQEIEWSDNWKKRNDLPKLVRVRVSFRSGDTRVWPDLLVAPHIAADVSCVYDSITKRCRGR